MAEIESNEQHSWRDISETVLGLAAEGIIPPVALDPVKMAPPYDKGAKQLKKEGGTKEDLVSVMDADMLSVMHNKVSKMNGASTMYDWLTMLDTAYRRFTLGDMWERAAWKLKQNQPIDLQQPYIATSSFLERGTAGIRPAEQIDFKHYQPFMKSGNEYIDSIFGGMPTDGPIVVFGDTGTGKSHYAAGWVTDFLNQYRDKTAAIYSFEMSEEHFLARMFDMYPEIGKSLSRLYVSGSVDKAEQIVAEVATHRFDFVVVDDMDNMVDGEATSGKYEAAYKIIKRMARLQKIPVVVLAQPNRGAKQSGRFLRKWDISWSGGGENSAALLIGLQNASRMDRGWTESNPPFPMEDTQMQYQIFLKSRDEPQGFGGLGAIITKMERGSDGKHLHRIWRGPLYMEKPKLWRNQSNASE